MPAPTLSYWCFQPGMAMRQLVAMGVRSVLLTSGTLSPLASFAHELQIPFRVQLENPHVIEPCQVCVLPVSQLSKGTQLLGYTLDPRLLCVCQLMRAFSKHSTSRARTG